MITFAEVKCYNCENSFPVYWNNWEKNLPIRCPFCIASFNEKFTEMLKHSLGTVNELNKELRSRHSDESHDLFQVDFKHVYVPIDKYRLDD